jgi:hypothetical protein
MVLARDAALNSIVRYQFAANPSEVTEVLAHLPVRIARELIVELDGCGEALRYDGILERAYYFLSEGGTLAIWSWSDIDASEACELLAFIVNRGQRVTEVMANEAFFVATGRQVSEPRTYRRAH